jgi:hypothetical protein
MQCARPARSGFSPLDEQLGLVPGTLTPRSQDHLTHLAMWMPFERATQMLKALTGVQISEATARRNAYRVGEALVAVQRAQAMGPVVAPIASSCQTKHIMSPDGAMVPLLHGQWAEVKTVVVGCVQQEKPDGSVHCHELSYFSRMLEAATFSEQASAELLRRGIDQGEQVGAIHDGAEWIDGFVDWQCKDAVRILDFAHAAEYVSEIGHLPQSAGAILPEDCLQDQLHALKQVGPTAVLDELKQVRDQYPHLEDLGKKLTYLLKREARMQYPQYRAAGWPIGSGCVESGNQVVMQARLKGSGMHWAPEHVNPMLVLRTIACNDRWEEGSEQAVLHFHQQKGTERQHRQSQRYDSQARLLQWGLLFWRSRLPRRVPPSPSPVPLTPKPSGSSRPSATHPWRRPLLAKK